MKHTFEKLEKKSNLASIKMTSCHCKRQGGKGLKVAGSGPAEFRGSVGCAEFPWERWPRVLPLR